MKNLLVAIIFSFFTFLGATAQSATNYRILFDKCDMGDGVLKMECSFTVNFAGHDSVTLDFGGTLQEEAVRELCITPNNIRYNFDPTSKQITFYRNRKDSQRVKMEYIFMM